MKFILSDLELFSSSSSFTFSASTFMKITNTNRMFSAHMLGFEKYINAYENMRSNNEHVLQVESPIHWTSASSRLSWRASNDTEDMCSTSLWRLPAFTIVGAKKRHFSMVVDRVFVFFTMTGDELSLAMPVYR